MTEYYAIAECMTLSFSILDLLWSKFIITMNFLFRSLHLWNRTSSSSEFGVLFISLSSRREDSGLLAYKEHLPVSQVAVGDTNRAGSEAKLTVGPLRCRGDGECSHCYHYRVA